MLFSDIAVHFLLDSDIAPDYLLLTYDPTFVDGPDHETPLCTFYIGKDLFWEQEELMDLESDGKLRCFAQPKVYHIFGSYNLFYVEEDVEIFLFVQTT